MALNSVVIGGIITTQPQERGAAVSFLVKTWRSWDGKVFSTQHPVEVFGKGKQAALGLRQGQSVVITGRYERSKYESNGQTKWDSKLTVMDISTNCQFHDPNQGQQGGYQGQQGNHQQGQNQGQPYGGQQQQPPQQQQQQQPPQQNGQGYPQQNQGGWGGAGGGQPGQQGAYNQGQGGQGGQGYGGY